MQPDEYHFACYRCGSLFRYDDMLNSGSRRRQVARLQDPYWWSLHEADAKSDTAVSKRNKWNARGRCIADAVREMKDDDDYNS